MNNNINEGKRLFGNSGNNQVNYFENINQEIRLFGNNNSNNKQIGLFYNNAINQGG